MDIVLEVYCNKVVPMPKFLDTQAISAELGSILKEAKEKIILISPYLKVNTQIQERLKTKSRVGTLSEIVIVYGKSELKATELEWLKEVQDLKLYEKSNLHAKCYINEDKAIICSMNLYDFSQQNNIEMGILITKQHDREAYDELIEDINNIKVNGERRKLDSFNKGVENTTNPHTKVENPSTSIKIIPDPKELTIEQKLKFQILKNWRLDKSRAERCSAFTILTDKEIKQITELSRVDNNVLYTILPKKTAIRYNEEILQELSRSKNYTIAKVVNLWYQEHQNSYDRVKLKFPGVSEEKWFDTTQELPQLNSVVAAKINNTWFNEYFYLD
jgi:hypothetical protein